MVRPTSPTLVVLLMVACVKHHVMLMLRRKFSLLGVHSSSWVLTELLHVSLHGEPVVQQRGAPTPIPSQL